MYPTVGERRKDCMKRFVSYKSRTRFFQIRVSILFCVGFLIGSGKLYSVENISRVRILSADSAVFVKEPDSHFYIQRAVKKEDLKGHPHIPGSSFFEFLNFLNPTRWFDREIGEDAFDILLENVSVLDENENKKKIDFVLIRHVKRGSKPNWASDQGFDGFPNLKKFAVDRPKFESEGSEISIKITLWYSDFPVLLSKLSKERTDSNRAVYIGHVHIDGQNPRTNDGRPGVWTNFGRFGVFFGANYRESKLVDSDPACISKDHGR